MRLLLSREALPGGALADLVRACRRRVLSGLELSGSEAESALSLQEQLGVPAPWLRLGGEAMSPAVTEVACAVAWASEAGAGTAWEVNPRTTRLIDLLPSWL